MPVIVATKELRYAGKTLLANDSFEASEKDAKLLVQIGKARLSNAEPPKSVNLPKEVMAKAPVKQEAVEDEAPKPKRAYHRRDMTAEEPASPKEEISFTLNYPAGPTGEGEQ